MQWTLEALKACYTIGATPTKKKLINNFIKNVWNSHLKCTPSLWWEKEMCTWIRKVASFWELTPFPNNKILIQSY